MNHFETIGAPVTPEEEPRPEYRELTLQELTTYTFSDYFRFSFTKRMDRDEALALASKIELFIGEASGFGDVRVYVGVKNHGDGQRR